MIAAMLHATMEANRASQDAHKGALGVRALR